MKTVCRGGHKIPDPENLGQVMRAPGFLVSNLAEENSKLLAYYIHHGVRVARTVTIPEITWLLVRSIRHYLGAKKSPLAYLVRDELNPKPEADNPSAN